MKICFTADEKRGLESILSYHFGHCPYYVIVDVENNVVKNVISEDNPMAKNHNPGDLPEYMKKKGIDMIVTGGMGPQAQDHFKNYGIKTVTGAYGVLQDVLEEVLQNKIVVETSGEELHKHEEGEDDNIRKLNMEISSLREQVAQLKSAIKKIEEKLDK